MSFKKLTSCKSVFYYTRRDKVPVRVTVSELLRDPMTDIRDLILDIYNNKEIELNCVITLKENQKKPKNKSKQQEAPKIKQVQLKDENLEIDNLSVIFDDEYPAAECDKENFEELCWSRSSKKDKIKIMPNIGLSLNPFTFQHKQKILENKENKDFSYLYSIPFILFYKYENCDILKNNWIMLYNTIKNYYLEKFGLEVNDAEYYVESRVFKSYGKNEIFIFFFLKDKRFHSNYISYIENYRSIDLRKLVLKQEYNEENKIENDCNDFLYMREQSGGNKDILRHLRKEDIKIISEYYKANTEHTNCAIYLLVEINNKYYEISLMSITVDVVLKDLEARQEYINNLKTILENRENKEKIIDNDKTKYYFSKLPAYINLYMKEVENKIPYHYSYIETPEEYKNEILPRIKRDSQLSPYLLIKFILVSEIRILSKKFKIPFETIYYKLLYPETEINFQNAQEIINSEDYINLLKIFNKIKELQILDIDLYDYINVTDNFIKYSKLWYYNLQCYPYIKNIIPFYNRRKYLKQIIEKNINFYNQESNLDIFKKYKLEGIDEETKGEFYNILRNICSQYIIFYCPEELRANFEELNKLLDTVNEEIKENKEINDILNDIKNRKKSTHEICNNITNIYKKTIDELFKKYLYSDFYSGNGYYFTISNFHDLFQNDIKFVYNIKHLKEHNKEELDYLLKKINGKYISYCNYPNGYEQNVFHLHIYIVNNIINKNFEQILINFNTIVSEAYSSRFLDVGLTRTFLYEKDVKPYNENILKNKIMEITHEIKYSYNNDKDRDKQIEHFDKKNLRNDNLYIEHINKKIKE
jgi:hypothetical protein